MRTTLDIDEDVLEAAKALAREKKMSAGEVISDLARKGLSARSRGDRPYAMRNGWCLMPNREGLTVTKERVDRLIEQAELEDGS